MVKTWYQRVCRSLIQTLSRDRLRAVQCPSDMIDQIGGWATAGVGQGYGEGHTLNSKWASLKSIN